MTTTPNLRDVYTAAILHKVGVGGPDLLPYKRGQMNHAYHFISKLNGEVPVGIAIQWNNYKHVNPRTGKQVTIPELFTFEHDNLKADYLFWCTQYPYFDKEVIPFVEATK